MELLLGTWGHPLRHGLDAFALARPEEPEQVRRHPSLLRDVTKAKTKRTDPFVENDAPMVLNDRVHAQRWSTACGRWKELTGGVVLTRHAAFFGRPAWGVADVAEQELREKTEATRPTRHTFMVLRHGSCGGCSRCRFSCACTVQASCASWRLRQSLRPSSGSSATNDKGEGSARAN